MTTTDLFHRLSAQYAMRLPFVAYKKPKKNKLCVIFQNDTQLHELNTFKESGFVFAPFSKNKQKIFIPGKPLEATIDFSTKKSDFSLKSPVFEQGKEKYTRLVSQAIKTIKESALQKVVLSRLQLAENTKDPLELFKALIEEYQEAFTYLFFHPEAGIWLGATPETLLKVNGLRFKTMALAGTQPVVEEQEVQWGKKEQEEQQLVVDELIENLKTFNIKNLKIAERETIRAGNVLHLRTAISGIMQDAGKQLEDLVNALHPTPAVCGLPRDLATSFIAEQEGYNREFYTGYLGELNQEEEQYRSNNRRNTENRAYKSIKKSTELYVNLRCMQFTEKQVKIYVGGGITHDSIAEKEWEETVAKAQTMLRVLSKS